MNPQTTQPPKSGSCLPVKVFSALAWNRKHDDGTSVNYRRIFIRFAAVCLISALAAACVGRESAAERKTGGDESLENGFVVYSSHDDEMVRLVVREFQERTGQRVTIVKGGTGELLKRIRDEGENPIADVVWGGGVESHESMKAWYAEYRPAALEYVLPRFIDPDGKWTSFSSLPMVIIYNRKLVAPENAPDAWSDLGRREWNGRIACADPSVSGSAFTVISTILSSTCIEGKPDYAVVGDIIRNIIVPGSSSAVYEGVADGIYPVGLTYEEAAIRMKRDGSDIEIVYPKDGTSAVPDGVALLNSSTNRKAGEQFIDFVLSADVQRIVSSIFMRRSVRSDIETPAGLPGLEKMRLVDYDVKNVAENAAFVQNFFREIRSETE